MESIVMLKIKYLLAKGLKILLNPPAVTQSNISKSAKICARSEISGCNIDRYSYVGYQNFIVNTTIGAFCSIADRCSIGGAMHPIAFVSSSPVFHTGKNVLKQNFASHEIMHTPQTIIENDVWIGQGAYVKAGLKIGTGAVVGMGSVVTHDIGPYEIWAGNPARLIRKRFSDEIIKKLLESEWWKWDEEKLFQNGKYFNDPNLFVKEIELLRKNSDR